MSDSMARSLATAMDRPSGSKLACATQLAICARGTVRLSDDGKTDMAFVTSINFFAAMLLSRCVTPQPCASRGTYLSWQDTRLQCLATLTHALQYMLHACALRKKPRRWCYDLSPHMHVVALKWLTHCTTHGQTSSMALARAANTCGTGGTRCTRSNPWQ